MKRHAQPKNLEQKMLARLREMGYKMTPQRLEIIRILSQDTSHPGAMDILRKVREKAPQISMSTVYYTLDMLKREGLIGEIEFYDKNNRYDVNVADHINLICRKCGKIEDFMEPLPFSHKTIEKQTGFQAKGMRFEYYGYCKNCAE